MRAHLTTALIAGMKPGDVVFDTEVRGLFVRLGARGGVPRYYLKTRVKRVQRIFTIGPHGRGHWTPETARREAVRLLGLIRDGRDLHAERAEEKASPTFAQFAERFLTEYAANRHKPRTLAEEQRLLRTQILPALGSLRLRDIDRAKVARLHAQLSSTPITANRVLALVSSILSWAEKVGERPVGSNPVRGLPRYPEKARERYLTREELQRLGEALVRAEAEKRIDWRFIALVRLLLFTGARLSEILNLKWAQVDTATGVVRLADSKTGPKNLFLPAPALEVLSRLPRLADNPHVLPGDRPGAPLVGVQKPWQRIRRLAGLEDLRLHDLRHAFASVAVQGGESLFVVGKLLGHSNARTTERYAHLAPDPVRAAAERAAAQIDAAMAGRSGEVVKMGESRR
jgi:integrase